MKYLIAAALIAAMSATASAKGFGHMPKLPKMGTPHEHKAPKAAHEPKAMKLGKAPKAGSMEAAMKSIDDIADTMIPDGPEPMIAAKYAAH